MAAVIQFERTRTNSTLTEREILDQQDFVDNTIHGLIEELLGRSLEWNLELTGDVRDAVIRVLENHKLTTEEEMYPYVEDADTSADEAEKADFAGFIEDVITNPAQNLFLFLFVVFFFVFIFFGLPCVSLIFAN